MRGFRIVALHFILLAALGLFLFSGCGGAADWGDVPAGSSRQITQSWWSGGVSRELWVLVVDDAPTEAGRALRAQVAQELQGSIDHYRQNGSCDDPDLAVFERKDRRVLVIPSSDPSLAIHGGIDAGLDLVTQNATSERGAGWEKALGAALEGMEASETRPHQVFAALRYWNEIIEGTRAPRSAADADFVANLGSSRGVRIFVVATRDDESEGELGVIRMGSLYSADLSALVYNEPACSLFDPSTVPRLASAFSFIVSACERTIFGSGIADCRGSSPCLSGDVQKKADGRAVCRVVAYVDPAQACPSEFGWLDAPELEGPPGKRVCEIQQLEGEALASCITDVECADCQPGFCLREPLEGAFWDTSGYCRDKGEWSWEQLRLVGGANGVNLANGARLAVTCQLE